MSNINLSRQMTIAEKPAAPKKTNDIKCIRSIRALDRLNLDLESPRFLQACDNLGIDIKECEMKKREDFEEKGVDDDIIDLRYKHFLAILMDTLNSVLEERRIIRNKQAGGNRSVSMDNDFSLMKSSIMGRSTVLMGPHPIKVELNKSSSASWALTSQQLDDQKSKELEKFETKKSKLQHSTMKILEEDELKRSKYNQLTMREGKVDYFEKKAEQIRKRKAKKNKEKWEEKQAHIKKLEMEKERERIKLEQAMKKDAEAKEKRLNELEEERKKKVQEKQEEYKKKRDQINKFQSDMGTIQQQLIEEQYQTIQEKLEETNYRHQQKILEQIDKTRTQNIKLDKKIQEFQYQEMKRKEEQLQKFKEYEDKVNKKLRTCYKSAMSFWDDLKEKHGNRIHAQIDNKGSEDKIRNHQIDLLVQKNKRAQENIERYHDEKEHDFMLKREFRRLKEIDTVKTMERQKRLEAKKKAQILQKEQERTNAVQMFKEHQNFLMKTRSEINLQTSIEKEALRRTLHTITHSLASPKEKTKLLKGLHLNIEYPNSPGDDSKEEDGKGNESS